MSDYDNLELFAHQKHMGEIEKAPLADRKEAGKEYFDAIKNDPAMVAERIEWMLDGNYGYGAMLAAKRVAGNTRMNRLAALSIMIAAVEWQCPQRMAVAAWKKLSREEQKAFDGEIAGMLDMWKRKED